MSDSMNDTKNAVCYNCNKLVPVSDLKFVLGSDQTAIPLCSQCRTTTKQKVPVKKKADDGRQARDSTRPEFYCERCRYKFKFDPNGKVDFRCPYCGKADKAKRYTLPHAEKLISDSEGYM